MKSDSILLAEDIEKARLVVINNLKFTPREIEVIACILHGKSVKSIAKFLSTDNKTLSTRAIDSHILNIRRKIGGSSKESIIDFVEKSDKYTYLHTYYSSMRIQKEFYKSLNQISAILQPLNPSFLLVLWEEKEHQDTLISKLRNYLELIGAKISIEVRDSFDKFSLIPLKTIQKFIIYFIPPEKTALCNESLQYLEKTPTSNLKTEAPNNSLFLFNDKNALDKAENLSNLNRLSYINVINISKPYFLLFEILKKFFPNLTIIDEIVSNFLTRYNSIIHYSGEKNKPSYTKKEDIHDSNINTLLITNHSINKFYYIFIAVLIFIIIGRFVSSRYHFQERYYTQNNYEQIEHQINEFAENFDPDQLSSLDVNHGSYIFLLQQAIDDLYEKYPNALNEPEMQSKFCYLACALANYYHDNNEQSNILLDNYLKSQYPSFKWFKHFNLKEFHDYVAKTILDRVMNHYNSKYIINNDDTIETIKTKLQPHPYALKDYILLNHCLAKGYAELDTKDWKNNYKFKIAEKYASIAYLGKEYNMFDSYSAQKIQLTLERDKFVVLLKEVQKKINQAFSAISEKKSLSKKIINDYAGIEQFNEDELKKVVNGFKKLEDDNKSYIANYKPWKKTQQNHLIPKDSLPNLIILCKENIDTQVALMDYYNLIEHNDLPKLQKAHTECLAVSLDKLSYFLNNSKIQNKLDHKDTKVQRFMLAKSIKNLAEVYYNKKITNEINKLAEMISHYDPKMKDKIVLTIKGITNSNSTSTPT